MSSIDTEQLRTVLKHAVFANGLNQVLAWTCGGGSLHVMAGIAIGVHYLMLIHASGNVFGNARTEKFYDLTGSSTYCSVTIYALTSAGGWSMLSQRQTLLAVFVLVWALRLGTFLFLRIQRDGHDPRFDKAKKHFSTFFLFWNVSGCWVFITALPAFMVISKDYGPTNLTALDYLGASLWVLGFVLLGSNSWPFMLTWK
eukprot:gnl/TRDRNA2_/TRDRNA2_162550_c0_seq2.p1 gnl/TRDRNA2_/TRDRNA2_162550_c0~~gnl/TRDRNA2_/TRDRNA2_162550_c0_seq2.p1  ORF type:complete len:199 (+),score=19.61 gnl/TRDRNA2_/TRDRNA2_162550_c0_seq2:19-615(+)